MFVKEYGKRSIEIWAEDELARSFKHCQSRESSKIVWLALVNFIGFYMFWWLKDTVRFNYSF